MITNGLSAIPVSPGEDVVVLVLALAQGRVPNLVQHLTHLF